MQIQKCFHNVKLTRLVLFLLLRLICLNFLPSERMQNQIHGMTTATCQPARRSPSLVASEEVVALVKCPQRESAGVKVALLICELSTGPLIAEVAGSRCVEEINQSLLLQMKSQRSPAFSLTLSCVEPFLWCFSNSFLAIQKENNKNSCFVVAAFSAWRTSPPPSQKLSKCRQPVSRWR